MVTKEQPIQLKIRGLTSSFYWGVRCLGGNTTVQRTIKGETVSFPVKNESQGWDVWQYGSDFGGERAAIRDAIEQTTEDDVFWDIGASRGFYTGFVGQRCKHVVSFEPNESARSYLERVLSKNNIAADVRPEALGDDNGSVELDGHVISSSSGSETNTVPVRRGESLTDEGVPTPSVIKIDCEGAEKDILDGLGSLLESVRLAYIEPHCGSYDKFGTSWDEIEQLLLNFGYELDWVETDCMEDLLRAKK